jgi:hypothetical protein
MDQPKIENAIEILNGVIMDFTDAVESLREVKETLYQLLDKPPEGASHEAKTD